MEIQNDPLSPSNDAQRSRNSEHEVWKPGDYLRTVRSHLRNNRHKEAFSVLLQAAIRYPEDPVILSYYGCLQAVVDKKYRSGVEACKRAIQMLKDQRSFSQEVLYPVFYLNLGRAYIAANRKKDAIEALKKGLKYDHGNGELNQELKGLGVRKPPPVPFLDRSNPINKYIGMILHAAGTKGAAGKKRSGKGISR